MGKTDITLDTHSLLWYLDSDYHNRLSNKALEVISEAELSSIIYVPIISLAEALHQIDKQRFNITWDKLMSSIRNNEAYEIVPLNEDVLDKAVSLKGLEIHDRLIVATALVTDSVLVSKDKEIRATGLKVIWSINDLY
jgi:PIN domain nuclease of toxin-antitoxin system